MREQRLKSLKIYIIEKKTGLNYAKSAKFRIFEKIVKQEEEEQQENTKM